MGWGLAEQIAEGTAPAIDWWEIEIPDLGLTVKSPREALLGRANGYGEPMHLSVDYEEQIQICNSLQAISASIAILWGLYNAATFHPSPHGLTQSAADLQVMDQLPMLERFNQNYTGQLTAAGALDGFSYMYEKAWAIDLQMLAHDQRNGTHLQGACNFGMIVNGKPIQGPGSAHNKKHRDYSQWCSGIVLCAAVETATGAAVDLRDYYARQWPQLAPYIDAYR